MGTPTTEIDVDAIVRAEVRNLRAYGLTEADRDDLAQEAAIGALLAMRRLDPNRRPEERRAYVARAARSRAIEFLRWRSSRVRREVPPDDVHPASTGGVDEVVSLGEALRTLDRVIETAGLSRRERTLVRDRLGIEAGDAEFQAVPRTTRSTYARRAFEKLDRAREGIECGTLIDGVFAGLFGK